jgi:hypothetical protein
MPKTKDQLPRIGDKVRFRIKGSKQTHDGIYTDNGFKTCSNFICYTTCEVDYWRPMEKTQ